MHRSTTSWPSFGSSSSPSSSAPSSGYALTAWLRRHYKVFFLGALGGAFLSSLLFTLLIVSRDFSSRHSSLSSSSPLAQFASPLSACGRIAPFFMPSRGSSDDDDGGGGGDDDDHTFPVANERYFEPQHVHRHARNLRLRGKINVTKDGKGTTLPEPTATVIKDNDNHHDIARDNENDRRDAGDNDALDPRLVLRPGHAATRLVSCLESRGPADAVIVPTRTRPSFVVTVMSDPAQHMQSHDLLHHGATDMHLLHVLAPLLHEECSRPDGGRVFLDGSAEVGFWPLYAAHIGCRVIALETNTDMLRAINSSMCADEELSSQIDVRSNVLATLDGPVLTYNRLDRTREIEPSEESARDRFSCETSIGSPCSMQSGVTLETLLRDTGEQDVFLLRLPGDALSIDALLNSSLVQSGRLTHIVLPLRPRLIGLDRAVRLISTLDDLGFDLSEMPYMPPDHQVSFFELLRSFVSALSTLTSHSRVIDWDERQQYAESLFACEDQAHACRADVIFSFAHTHFVAGVVPAHAARVLEPEPIVVSPAQVVAQGDGEGHAGDVEAADFKAAKENGPHKNDGGTAAAPAPAPAPAPAHAADDSAESREESEKVVPSQTPVAAPRADRSRDKVEREMKKEKEKENEKKVQEKKHDQAKDEQQKKSQSTKQQQKSKPPK